jgi:hypothetical protein
MVDHLRELKSILARGGCRRCVLGERCDFKNFLLEEGASCEDRAFTVPHPPACLASIAGPRGIPAFRLKRPKALCGVAEARILHWNRRSPMPQRNILRNPADYRVVPGSQGPRRDFRITVGLREGWDPEGRVFDISEAVKTARRWMQRRVGAGEPAVSGMFTRAEVTYAWPRPDGTAGSDQEPVALFTGEAVHAYLGHLSDAAIEALLNELAGHLGAALGQERIYVAFANRTWILDAGAE